MDPNLDPVKWELPPRKEIYTYAEILPVEYLGIEYADLRYWMSNRQAERNIVDRVYSWIINSRFHEAVEKGLSHGRNNVDIYNFVGLYGELKTMILLATMLPDPLIGIQVDENDQVVFPTFRGRNEVQLGLHGASVILADPRLHSSDVKKKEIDILMGCNTSQGLLPVIGQVKLNLSDAGKVETDIGMNRLTYFTKVFNYYPGFVPIFFTLGTAHNKRVSELLAAYQHVGGTHVPIGIDRKAFKSLVAQYRQDYDLVIEDY